MPSRRVCSASASGSASSPATPRCSRCFAIWRRPRARPCRS
jgi:hypothetical protein